VHIRESRPRRKHGEHRKVGSRGNGGSEMDSAVREFYVIIERDEDGYYVGEVPQLQACYSQGRSLDELMANMREVIELCLEEQDEEILSEVVGIQRVVV
jgi:predicted RNase H-like HicB family nuclease